MNTCVIILVVAVHFFPGQVQGQAPREISFESVDIPEIRALSVGIIYQDRSGFIWFGAQTGLYRFDGYEIFSATDLDEDAGWLDGQFIEYIGEDSNGNIWILFNYGVAVWSDDRGQFQRIESFDGRNFNALAATSDGRLWLASKEGLIRYDPVAASNTLFAFTAPLLSTFTTSVTSNLFLENERWIWMGTPEGVLRFDTIYHRYALVPIEGVEDTPYVYTIAGLEGTSMFFAGTFGHGLFVKHATEDSFSKFTGNGSDSLPQRLYILALQFDENEHLWIATRSNGMYVIDPRTGQILRHFYYNLTSSGEKVQSRLMTFSLDAASIGWVGTFNGIFRQHTTSHILPINSTPGGRELNLDGNGVKASYIDRDGFLWFGTPEGNLLQVDPSTGRLLRNRHVSDIFVYNIAEDVRHNLWIASFRGLFQYDPRTDSLRNIPFEHGSVGTDVNQLAVHVFIDSSGRIWVSTGAHGLWVVDEATLTLRRSPLFDHIESLRDSYVWFVYEDKYEDLWIGTDIGLFHYIRYADTTRHFVEIPGDSTSVSDNRVISIGEDDKGTLWIGTRNGINRYNRATNAFQSFSLDDGLPNNEISCILPSDDPNLWIATRFGLARIDTDTFDISAFNEHDGLPVTDFLFNSCTTDSYGNIYAGSESGLFRFHPDDLPVKASRPRVRVTGYEIEGDRRFLAGTKPPLSLRYDQNYVTFYFSIMDFLGIEDANYSYRLMRHDEPGPWIAANRRNYASYSDLSPGGYTLQVKGKHYGGLESDLESISFTIHPPFWARWWYRLTGLFLLLGLIFSASMWRFYNLLEVEALEKENELLEQKNRLEAERTRTRIAKDLHDDLGGDMSRLVMSLERALQEETLPPELRGRIRAWHAGARRAAEGVSDLSWILDAGRDTLRDFVGRLYREAEHAFDEDAYTFAIVSRMPDRKLEFNVRRDLFLIYREAITNIQRHAHATHVDITVSFDDGVFEYIVADDGVGCDPDDSVSGSGRRNMYTRALRNGADLLMESAPGQGMKVTLRYKMA